MLQTSSWKYLGPYHLTFSVRQHEELESGRAYDPPLEARGNTFPKFYSYISLLLPSPLPFPPLPPLFPLPSPSIPSPPPLPSYPLPRGGGPSP